MVGGFALTLTILPTLLNKDSIVSRWTSITSTVVLISFSITFLDLSLIFSFFNTLLNGMCWSYIALFRKSSSVSINTYSIKRIFSKDKLLAIFSLIIICAVVYSLTNYSIHDYVFTFGTFVITASLIPTILYKNSFIPRWASIPTFTVLFIYTFNFLTLDFYLSSLAHLLNALAWLFIIIYRGS